MKKSIFITFDFGMRGDFDGLYKWLDEHSAEERGYGVALIKEYKVPLEHSSDKAFLLLLRRDLSNRVKLGSSDRIYVIFNSFESVSKIKGGFVFGKGKQAPWSGFAEKDNESLDLDL